MPVAQAVISWNIVVSIATSMAFGINDNKVFYNGQPEAVPYRSALAAQQIKSVRFHDANLTEIWTSAATKDWDSSKITATYNEYKTAFGSTLPTITQNIPNWPSWMKQDSAGRLDPSEYQNYANLCARLVKIVNVDLKSGVKYWEPLNETADRYKANNSTGELWKIYGLTATAMRNVDPSIKVGGPALTYEDYPTAASFLQSQAANADFLSFHRYSYGPDIVTVDDDTFKRDYLIDAVDYFTIICPLYSLILSVKKQFDFGKSQ
jgi:xylan 1,4-beta-xylosidase